MKIAFCDSWQRHSHRSRKPGAHISALSMPQESKLEMAEGFCSRSLPQLMYFFQQGYTTKASSDCSTNREPKTMENIPIRPLEHSPLCHRSFERSNAPLTRASSAHYQLLYSYYTYSESVALLLLFIISDVPCY